MGDWLTWLILAGRGYGKTRTGAEAVREQVETSKAKRVALVGRTAADVRDVMVEGESGLLAISPPYFRPQYYPSKRRVVWPNGAIATCYSGDKPDVLRGPQHDFAWVDELAAFRYADDTWSNLGLGLRLGEYPRTVVTTTPRPIKIIRDLVKDGTCIVTPGTTYENIANLSAQFQHIIKRYEGTTLGRQELLAELLEDIPGALWSHKVIDSLRVRYTPDLTRIVVAIDPATTSNKDSNDTGIIVCGRGADQHGYVLDDLTMHDTPNKWAKRAVDALKGHKADRIVAEVNNGGDLVKTVIHTIDKNAPFKTVHASRSKRTRAEPIAALYEQGRIHHVGTFAMLEDEMCTWLPLSGDDSPDRMDALVWGMTELMLSPGGSTGRSVGAGDEMERGY